MELLQLKLLKVLSDFRAISIKHSPEKLKEIAYDVTKSLTLGLFEELDNKFNCPKTTNNIQEGKIKINLNSAFIDDFKDLIQKNLRKSTEEIYCHSAKMKKRADFSEIYKELSIVCKNRPCWSSKNQIINFVYTNKKELSVKSSYLFVYENGGSASIFIAYKLRRKSWVLDWIPFGKIEYLEEREILKKYKSIEIMLPYHRWYIGTCFLGGLSGDYVTDM
jgi:hypothetical protein